ncbi:MAG: adenosylcobalamin-dependent ribonucleoside-diphosphate reductase [Candidatus Kerfeldbacteria bacterium]|nr:adenosylcobalamin-dependent ribonucleoside-diphosphate reductase [Candidatus Kerfeldbacteria bacterium]
MKSSTLKGLTDALYRAVLSEGTETLYATPERFAASDNALEVFRRRYAALKGDGTKETPEEMCRRVAKTLAEVEFQYGKSDQQVREFEQDFYNVLMRKEFTPAGRTLTNAGTPFPLIANCIVLHIDDSMDGIFSTLRDAALLQQAGSGLGFPLHLMRPAGSNTKRSQGQASGPISFLKVYNQAFGVIKQQNRHGANMAVMRVDHPDILEFVHCKEKEGEIQNFNISVGLTDEFMRRVKDNDPEPWLCTWNGTKMKPRRIVRSGGETAIKVEELTMTAREMFQEIIATAWINGEPGCVFLDEVNAKNPLPGLGRIEACNPCGEQFLHDGDVCNLGSINLEMFVTAERTVDFARLKEVTRRATRLLDNVIDISNFPAERVNKVARANRRIGLGIMGFADMLYKLGIAYNSDDGRKTAEDVMRTINEASHEMSRELAKEKGVFPNWEKSIYKMRGEKMRNAALTNIAPTGTISMLFDVSGGVEPYFALAYHYKGILGGDVKLHYVNKHLESAFKERGMYSEELMDRISKEGSLQNIDEIPADLKKAFVVAMDISADDHIRMQAAFQKHLDNAISKTVNFPNKASKEDVLNGYLLAWELRCKGCTVYRDGSRVFQILNLNQSEPAGKKPAAETATEPVQTMVAAQIKIVPRIRPEVMQGTTYKVATAYGNLYITINDDDDGRPFEVFASIGKNGGFFGAQSEAICRMASLSLRSGIDPEEVASQLKGIRGPDVTWHNGGQIHSLADAIGQILERHVKRDQTQLNLGYAAPKIEAQPPLLATDYSAQPNKPSIADFGHAPACPDCGNMLTVGEGCLSCKNCGFSKCG